MSRRLWPAILLVTLLASWVMSGTAYAADAPPCWPKDTAPIIRTNAEGFTAVWGCKGKYAWVVTGFVGRWSELAPAEVTNAAFGKLMSDAADAERLAAWNRYIDTSWDSAGYVSLQPLRLSAIEALGLVNPSYRVKDNPLSSTRPVYAYDATARVKTEVKGERIADNASCDCAYKAIEESGGLYCAVKLERVALCVSR
jgi:hypothetical protein